jgi:hypothetical protein
MKAKHDRRQANRALNNAATVSVFAGASVDLDHRHPCCAAIRSPVVLRGSMRSYLLSIAFAVFYCTCTVAQLDEVFKKAGDAIRQRDTSSLTDDKIVAGLKQALQVSTGKAVALTGRPDGFLKNQAIKILLPPKLETVGKGLRLVGMGASVDQLEGRDEPGR